MHKEYKVLDAAAWLIAASFRRVAEDDCGEELYLTHSKLQSLLYIAQAVSLGRRDKPLFENQIYARPLGPRVLIVELSYGDTDSKGITKIDDYGSVKRLSCSEKDVLDDVMDAFNRYTPSYLNEYIKASFSWREAYSKGAHTPIHLTKLKEWANTDLFEE